jgi:hypothetical protein
MFKLETFVHVYMFQLETFVHVYMFQLAMSKHVPVALTRRHRENLLVTGVARMKVTPNPQPPQP